MMMMIIDMKFRPSPWMVMGAMGEHFMGRDSEHYRIGRAAEYA